MGKTVRATTVTKLPSVAETDNHQTHVSRQVISDVNKHYEGNKQSERQNKHGGASSARPVWPGSSLSDDFSDGTWTRRPGKYLRQPLTHWSQASSLAFCTLGTRLKPGAI